MSELLTAVGLCACGCGGVAPLIHRGPSRGLPARFIWGHNSKRTEAERLAAFFALLIPDPLTGCVNFSGQVDHNGHGRVRVGVGNRTTAAHRYAWIAAGREIPADRPHVLHNCPAGDNRICCNVDHLWVGTQAHNAADAARKRRLRRGSVFPYGVSPNHDRYLAKISIANKQVCLGTYDTVEEAAEAAAGARDAYHASIGLPPLLSPLAALPACGAGA